MDWKNPILVSSRKEKKKKKLRMLLQLRDNGELNQDVYFKNRQIDVLKVRFNGER